MSPEAISLALCLYISRDYIQEVSYRLVPVTSVINLEGVSITFFNNLIIVIIIIIIIIIIINLV